MQSAKNIVKNLDKCIIGHESAKRMLAISVINRWRRSRLDKEQQKNIMPKNLLLVGPSGGGKTELARRLSDLVDAPFIKVEATKFTEVGYVGQDVERIIKDLVDDAVRAEQEKIEEASKNAAEEKALLVIMALLKDAKIKGLEKKIEDLQDAILSGKYDDIEVEVDVPSVSASVEIIVPPGLEEFSQQLEQLFKSVGSDRSHRKNVSVPKAYKFIVNSELDKVLDSNHIIETALKKVENFGIVFLDEIDKLIAQTQNSNSDISRGGVQRDLLPLLEGTVVSTKYGPVATDHILFIAAGAFINVKPTDLASELQGRLPVVVNLSSLTQSDLRRILVEPEASLVNQYKWLLSAENHTLDFTSDALDLIAELAFHMNKDLSNLGARRLSMIMEVVLEPLMFESNVSGVSIVDFEMVKSRTQGLLKERDDVRWVL